MQTCNPGLDTTNWSVIRRKTSDKGTSLKLGICQISKGFIAAKKNRLFFGIAQAVCYFQKEKKKEAMKQMNDVDDSHLVTDTEGETEDDANSETTETTVIAKRNN